MTDKFWQIWVHEIADAALREARFATAAGRCDKCADWLALLAIHLARHRTQAWLHALAGKLPIAPLLNMQQALHNPYVQRIAMQQALPHAAARPWGLATCACWARCASAASGAAAPRRPCRSHPTPSEPSRR